jgi:ABC-type multidrug transport system ATPase subunit
MSSIEVRRLTKHFGSVVAVEDLSFDVGAGEVVGLLGANGAGKTTTMKILLGLASPTSGEARIDDVPASRVDRRALGYVPQGLGLYSDLTVAENIAFSAAAFGVPEPSLAADGLEAVAGRRISQVSLGLRRRVAFAVARCHEPSVLVLDEPTSGVGPLGRARLWESIHATADEGAAILVSTHYMDEAEECDRVVLMAGGREVASGAVDDVIGANEVVTVSGEVSSDRIDAIRDAGGHVLMDGDGWRVVGLDRATVSSLAGETVRTDVAPATFEEAFVALSR